LLNIYLQLEELEHKNTMMISVN